MIRLKVSLATKEQEDTSVAILQMCAAMARDLSVDAAGMQLDGEVALRALAGVFEDMVKHIRSTPTGQPH